MKITFCLLIAACLAFVGCNQEKPADTTTPPADTTKPATKAPATPAPTNAPAAK
jgi:hypothetical protein